LEVCSGSLFPPLVEGRPVLEKTEGEPTKQGAGMGCDGIAISADGSRLFYCPLGSRTLYSVETDELVDRSFAAEMTANVVEEGDKGGVPVTARNPTRPATSTRRTTSTTPCCGAGPTLSGDDRPRSAPALAGHDAAATDGYLYVPRTSSTARRATTKVRSRLDALLALPHPVGETLVLLCNGSSS